MVIREAAARLTNSDTPFIDARALLSHVIGCDAMTLARELTPDEKRRFDGYIARRAAGEPVAYIVGEKEFMGKRFLLNGDCLIPRPDTETVVENLIETNGKTAPNILDLCCGSGCIGLSLAMFIKDARVSLCDISDGALEMTRKNISLHGLEERTEVFRLDVLTQPLPSGFDIIVCNPPYIPSAVTDSLEVAKTEPRLALDGGEDGLMFYRAITPKAFSALNAGGVLAYETGYDQADDVCKLLRAAGFADVTVKKDYGGNDRLVRGEKP